MATLRAPSTMVFALDYRRPVLEVPRFAAPDFLQWLGLGRPDFGAIEASVLFPLCMHRLWHPRLSDGSFRYFGAKLARSIAAHPYALVHFG